MNELTSNLRSALALLDAQTARIGKDLGTESQNLQELVADRDAETQKQLALLSESLDELHESLSTIRRHLVDSYSAAKMLNTTESSPPDTPGKASQPGEEDLDPALASEIRHDEPTTLSGIFRSLLMANEPGQRKRSGLL